MTLIKGPGLPAGIFISTVAEQVLGVSGQADKEYPLIGATLPISGALGRTSVWRIVLQGWGVARFCTLERDSCAEAAGTALPHSAGPNDFRGGGGSIEMSVGSAYSL